VNLTILDRNSSAVKMQDFAPVERNSLPLYQFPVRLGSDESYRIGWARL